jgi:hypothetical protein
MHRPKGQLHEIKALQLAPALQGFLAICSAILTKQGSILSKSVARSAKMRKTRGKMKVLAFSKQKGRHKGRHVSAAPKICLPAFKLQARIIRIALVAAAVEG